MKYLKQVYAISSGTRRYRKLKALQFYANLQKNGRIDDSFEIAKRKKNANSQKKPAKKAQQSLEEFLEEHDVDDSFELAKKHYKSKKEETKKQAASVEKAITKKEKKQKKQDSKNEFLSSDSDLELIQEIENGSNLKKEKVEEQDFSQHIMELPHGDKLVFVQNKQKVIFTGEFEVCCLYGQVHVNGLSLSSKDVSDKQKVFMHKASSLLKNSLLSFDTVSRDSTISDSKNASKLLEIINHNVILINGKQDCDKIIDKICENFDEIQQKFTKGFSNILYIHHTKVLNHQLIPFKIINVLTTAKQFSSTQNYIQWTEKQQNFVEDAVKSFTNTKNQSNDVKSMLICGTKNCGKSMFTLYSINRLLDNFDRICVLDTDLGQSLFHFPGTVNLFSMSKKDIHLSNLTHIHFIKPVLSIYVGEYSPQYFIQQYIAGIKKCFKFYQEYFRNCPLIVNTHGYITNIGELLLYEIQDIIEPKFIGLLSTNEQLIQHLTNSNTRLERLSLTTKSKDMPNFKSRVEDITNPSFEANKVKVNEAKRHRKDDIIFQYLTNQVKLDNTYPFQNLYSSQYGQLCLQKPFEAPLNSIKYYLLETQTQIEGSNDIAKHFNCSIVALFDQSFSFSNTTTNCIGFAFVRDIDLKKNTIEIITSQSIINDLPRVSTFIKSNEMAFSKRFYLQNQHSYNEISELTYDVNGDFSSKRTLDVPFVLPKSSGLGNISFRSRVSNRK
ncbi:pre-mRNA cleavage complex II protein Clp1 (macronuclear) [Tetrahymena thermophila SB210]|uniref:Pre-mRNA cleavage complex II protein Clp1 n=1 Tax=Tetrahymena thermophila (strain SB210) TaxID=312017 RepID=I7LVT2_TETTS|nr:pre-mRNA cleavage complex II protein Clp1 [Tetrahymena thermophila SB210]EAR99671.2 pre-mRNA cleavage complex II protein Clp1 [Tetrahymena thermophila SB210]|eukprot:XP_001019916.2 pre-mRNA cleavage complex II protein Clp1 [Tetrahymena thermophila SB210]